EGGEGGDDGDNDEPLFYRRVVTTPVSELGDPVLEASNQVIDDPIHDPAHDFLPTRRQTASPTVAALRCGLSPSSLGCSGGTEVGTEHSVPRCVTGGVEVGEPGFASCPPRRKERRWVRRHSGRARLSELDRWPRWAAVTPAKRVGSTRPKGRRFRRLGVVSCLGGLLCRRLRRDPASHRVL